ncbi:hypothetical protein [Microbacterium galbinum]|uniref:hypothetical protein n=1 Tax=Microbacterium galbinum TaxID=2851646 RepID=UPI001FFD6366|nr:hypothetical protein [Microbacterium galbinum]MCK2031244.1 hypothetical protein [Microbacterium galbinum]
MSTENYHHVELQIAGGELVTGFTCSAPVDASCRRRPKDHDQRESWSTEEATETGFRCWAVEWVEAVGTADAVIGSADAVLASVPVEIHFEEGVGIDPVQTESSDSRVLAALNAMMPYAKSDTLDDYEIETIERMRAALRAAGVVL